MTSIKNHLRAFRASQPFNLFTTSTARAVLTTAGLQSEFVANHLIRTGIVRRRLPNGRSLRLWSHGDDGVSNSIYWRGWNGHEPETSTLFFRLATKARTTLDIGAYVGSYSLLAAHANPKGRVHAFEPMPSMFKRLLHNVELNQVPNIQCLAIAVGDMDGTAEFFHSSTELSKSSLWSPSLSGTDDVCSETVSVITLDRFVRENNLAHIDLIKIDTEGTEAQVLRGMVQTLSRDRPNVFCEVLPGQEREQPLEEVLHPMGYKRYLLTDEGPVVQNRIMGHPMWRNYLFTVLDPAEVVFL